MDNKNLINGSSALAPKYKPRTPNVNEEFEKLRRDKREKDKALAQKKLIIRAKIIGSIVLAFAVGVMLIGRYAAVYNLQKELTSVKNSIHNFSMENENLKVQLIKSSNMKQIEDTAKTKLNMTYPDKNSIIYTEATKDYFAKDTNEKKKNMQEDFIAKIKNMLF
jgi:cell division protein FtsL